MIQVSFETWLQGLGIHTRSLYPSVKCGLEFAICSAISSARSLPLHGFFSEILLQTNQLQSDKLSRCSSENGSQEGVLRVNSLMNNNGAIKEACEQISHELRDSGYTAVKVKVDFQIFLDSTLIILQHSFWLSDM